MWFVDLVAKQTCLFISFTFTQSTAKDRLRHQLAAPGLLMRFVYNNLNLSSDLGATELNHDLVSRDALKQLVELMGLHL